MTPSAKPQQANPTRSGKPSPSNTPSPSNKRSRFFVDQSVQGALVRRVMVHWMLFFVLAFTFFAAWQLILTGEPLTLSALQVQRICAGALPIIVSLLVLLPIFLRDTVRLSHRFAGPVLRLKNELRALAEGKENPPVAFRDGDFWQELAEDFNAVAKLVHEKRASNTTLRALSTANRAEAELAKVDG